MSSRSADRCPLTPRQKEILQWISYGKSSEEVAAVMGVSIHTVNGKVVEMMNRTGCSNRIGVVSMALRKGWIQ